MLGKSFPKNWNVWQITNDVQLINECHKYQNATKKLCLIIQSLRFKANNSIETNIYLLWFLCAIPGPLFLFFVLL